LWIPPEQMRRDNNTAGFMLNTHLRTICYTAMYFGGRPLRSAAHPLPPTAPHTCGVLGSVWQPQPFDSPHVLQMALVAPPEFTHHRYTRYNWKRNRAKPGFR
jgi:hypothetical protein